MNIKIALVGISNKNNDSILVQASDKSVIKYLFSFISTKTFVVATQKNHLNCTVILSTKTNV